MGANLLRSLTRPFNATPEIMEAPVALVLVAFIALLIFQAWALWLEQPFDPYSFGVAAGAAMGGGGVASYGQGYLNKSRRYTPPNTAVGKVDEPD